MNTIKLIIASSILIAGCSSPETGEPTAECNYGYVGCASPGDPCYLKDRGAGVCRGSCETVLACCFGCWDGEECRSDIAACGAEGEACAAPASASGCAKEGDACVTPTSAAGTCAVLPDKCELSCVTK